METKQNVTNIILAIILAVVLLFGGIISAGMWSDDGMVAIETVQPTITPTSTTIETEVPAPVVTPIPSVEPTPIPTPIATIEPTPTPTPIVINPIPKTYNMVLPVDFTLDYREGEIFAKDILKTSSIAIVVRDYAEDFGIQGEWKVIKFNGCMMFNDKDIYGTTPVNSMKDGDLVVFGVKPTGANTVYIEIGYFYNGDNLNSKFITFTTN